MLYDGYIRTKGKQSLTKFKDVPSSELLTLDEAQNLHGYAGRLAENTIMFDVDTEEQSDILMDIVEAHDVACRVIQTSRGRHFTMLNNGVLKCGTGVMLACGIRADIKAGTSSSYEVLKLEGVERFVEWDDENENYQKFPIWMTPIKSDIDFINLGAGDGRNSTLFSYILTLQSNGFSKEEARETIRIINQYVLSEPLLDDELDVVLRDESFKNTEGVFFKSGKFLHNQFAKYIMSEYNVKRINGNLYFYDEYYRPLTKRTAFKIMQTALPDIKQNQKVEVLGYIDSELDGDHPVAGVEFIGFRNGIYDIKSGKMIENSPEIVVPNTIPHDFKVEAYSQTVEDSLNAWACGDKQIRSLLEEIIGYTFLRDTRFQISFILTGEKKNGKSTFLDTLVSLLGEQNVVSMDLKELDSNFKTNAIFGKLANIGDDISGKNIEDSSVFKKIVSGERLTVDVKFGDMMTFRPYSKLIFSTNNQPRIHDKTGAVGRRLIIIPFDATFDEADSGLRDKLKAPEAIEYLIKLGIQGLERLIKNDQFSQSERANKAKDEYAKHNDSILGFVDEFTLDQIFHEDVGTVYQNYKYYTNDTQIDPESKVMFGKRLCKLFNLKTEPRKMNGKSVRMYIKA